MADNLPKPDLLNDPITSSNNIDAGPSPTGKDSPVVTTKASSNGFSTPAPAASKNPLADITKAATNGPVAQNVKAVYNDTAQDFKGLKDSTVAPQQKTATGQPLTTYHSFFYNLLTWKHPRATALTFVANILLIFAGRYLPLARWFFKSLAFAFGATAVAELAGKPFGTAGLASHFRPKKYLTLSRESVDGIFDELHQLLNFFVLEFQRVLFAENVVLTASACVLAAISYGLIKFVPFWGLTLIGTISVYLVPLVYVTNQELIDAQIDHASRIVNTQAEQVRNLTAQHTARATDLAKTYASDISSRAGDLVNQARGTISSAPSPPATEPKSQKEFPAVPTKEPLRAETPPVVVN